MSLERAVELTHDLVYRANELSLELAVCGLVLAFSLGKNGLKRIPKSQELWLWKATAWAALAKLGFLVLNLLWNSYNFFRLS